MKSFLFLLCVVLSTTCFGQNKAERDKIKKFKEDFLTGVTLFKTDTLITSTGLMTRARMLDNRRISIFPTGGTIRHDEFYYNDTTIPQVNYSYKLPSERLTGVTKHFNAQGELEYTQDHDKGTWEVVKNDHYPFYPTLVKMKQNADSLLVATYGAKFFKEHILWTPGTSAWYDSKSNGANWCAYEIGSPKRFLLTYAIKMTEDEAYDDQIEIQLDSTGHLFFPFGQYNTIKGFQHIGTSDIFMLNKKSAIEKATALGLMETETKKAFTFLGWKYTEPPVAEMFNGEFVYNVAFNTRKVTQTISNSLTRVVYKYDVYLFNPWTGEFMEKIKMKSFKEKGTKPGMPPDLLPDI